jgi:hypothetical protein
MTGSPLEQAGNGNGTGVSVLGAHSPVSLYTLEQNLKALVGSEETLACLDLETGHFVAACGAPSHVLLPLSRAALQAALGRIAHADGWLLPRSPVFYTDPMHALHVDFPGLAGFTLDSRGGVLSRAVNPY